jgi:hypothetical protein
LERQVRSGLRVHLAQPVLSEHQVPKELLMQQGQRVYLVLRVAGRWNQ